MNASTKTNTSTANAFAGLGDMLAGGFDASVADDANDQLVLLEDIEIRPQVRQLFEDADNSLHELGQSLMNEQLQAVLLRPNKTGANRPYLLVCGERRVRAAKLVGMTHLRARIKPMSDEQAADAQFAENVHRQNLTLIEEAKRLQADLKALGGDVAALVLKHGKSHSWVSKRLGLLELGPQAQRLMREQVSADAEVIHGVKQVEQRSPERARELVDELKTQRGKGNAREAVEKAKAAVKPRKPSPTSGGGGSVATAPDRRDQEPSGARVFARAKKGSAADLLGEAFFAIFEASKTPQAVIDGWSPAQLEEVTVHLSGQYEAGKHCSSTSKVALQGMRHGLFAPDGAGALALCAFLDGAEPGVKFNVLNILGYAKP